VEQGQGKGATGIGVQKVFQLRLDMIVSHGGKYEGESHEQVMAKMEAFVKENWPDAHFTPTGGYYLIDGDGTWGQREVCRPADFDFENMRRKPGTFPPSWSLTAEMQVNLERQLRVLQEHTQPPITRNPPQLYTAKELDRIKQLDQVVHRGKNKRLAEIAEERPDLIDKKQVPKQGTKIVVKKTGAKSKPRQKVLVRKRTS
jgi:hypothetical protein